MKCGRPAAGAVVGVGLCARCSSERYMLESMSIWFRSGATNGERDEVGKIKFLGELFNGGGNMWI